MSTPMKKLSKTTSSYRKHDATGIVKVRFEIDMSTFPGAAALIACLLRSSCEEDAS